MNKIIFLFSPKSYSVHLSVNSLNLCETYFSTNTELSSNFLEKRRESSFRFFEIKINPNSSNKNFLPTFLRFSGKNNQESLCK